MTAVLRSPEREARAGGAEDLEDLLWARHRAIRPIVAAAAVAAAALAPDHRPALLTFALAWYAPIAVAVATMPRRPAALGAWWWLILASDAAALALALASVPSSEPVVFMGAVLVAVVNGASFGSRAGVISGIVLGLSALVGHAGPGASHSSLELAFHLGGFAVAVGVATYLIGLQTEDLQAARARAELHAAELERVDRLRSRIVSTLAHDVRAPLAAVQGAVRTVLGLRGRIDPAEEEELLRGIDRQASRLVRLATGLLDLARLEEGRLELHVREVDLRAAVLEALSYVDHEGRIRVEVEPDVRIVVDPERLDQILVNLTSNCLRHGAPPFVVSAAREGRSVAVVVADAGPGVPPERRADLFEPFRRGDAAGSVGLGLWIVRMLAEVHGGSVAYEPNRPRGARFIVRLPAAEGEAGVLGGTEVLS